MLIVLACDCRLAEQGGNIGFELHRAPSSLFYLQYDDEDDDDDYEYDQEGKKVRRFSNLPSARKLSAAAYMPRPQTETQTGQTESINSFVFQTVIIIFDEIA